MLMVTASSLYETLGVTVNWEKYVMEKTRLYMCMTWQNMM